MLVLRHPEEVVASKFHRELSPWALYVPFSSALVLVGLVYIYLKEKMTGKTEGDGLVGETTNLLQGRASIGGRRVSQILVEQSLDPSTEMNRRISTNIMGIPQFDTESERERRSSFAELLHKEEFVKGLSMDEIQELTEDGF